MSYRFFFSVILISLMINSCIFSKKNSKSEEINNKVGELVLDRTFVFPAQDVDYEVIDASISDSILFMNIKYKGDSDKDVFNLMFNGMYAKSMPPIATLFLVQTQKGENEFVRDLKFDISKAKYMGKEKTVIKVNGWKERLILNP